MWAIKEDEPTLMRTLMALIGIGALINKKPIRRGWGGGGRGEAYSKGALIWRRVLIELLRYVYLNHQHHNNNNITTNKCTATNTPITPTPADCDVICAFSAKRLSDKCRVFHLYEKKVFRWEAKWNGPFQWKIIWKNGIPSCRSIPLFSVLPNLSERSLCHSLSCIILMLLDEIRSRFGEKWEGTVLPLAGLLILSNGIHTHPVLSGTVTDHSNASVLNILLHFTDRTIKLPFPWTDLN